MKIYTQINSYVEQIPGETYPPVTGNLYHIMLYIFFNYRLVLLDIFLQAKFGSDTTIVV
jgi:response regulator of citrate/malate metabolism